MKMWKRHIKIIVLALVLNVVGRFAAYAFELPAYLNLCGTIIASYISGPIAGSIAAVLSCALSSVFSPSDWYFLIADIAVAVASGLIARRNKYFSKFSLIISATAFFTVVKALILVLVNLSVYEGKTGIVISDAIVDYLFSLSVPNWMCYTFAAICISFIDTFLAMNVLYFFIHIHRSGKRRKRAAELKKELHASVLIGLVVTVGIISVFGPVHNTVEGAIRTEESISFVEKLYNSENGLPGGCLNDIAMTADGSMWVGTYGGLFRFNGSNFMIMENIPSVRSVQCLFVDEEDRLWAGTQDAGVTLLNIDMTWDSLDMNSGLPSNSVKCISRDSNGLYYFGTTGGLVVAEYEDGRINIVKVNNEAGNIKDMAPDKSGHMIVMSNLGDVKAYSNGDVVAELTYGEFSAKGVSMDSNDNIYIGTEENIVMIYTFSSGKFRYKRQMHATGLKTLRDFYFDDSGIIYASADNGIGYFDSAGHFTVIESGEFNNSVDHIFKDYQGNIWFTSSRCGLLCLGRSSFTDVFKLCNEKQIVCNAIREWNGNLYVGSNDGLKILNISIGVSVKNSVTEALTGVRIRSLAVSDEGTLLIATYDRGLMELDPQENISEYVSPNETSKLIRMVCVLSDGTVVSSSDASIVFMRDHAVLSKLVLGEDLLGASVLNILEADENTLLLGTDGDGIAVVRDRKLERYITRDDGLTSGVVLRIVKDKRSGGYFVMTGSGICYMDSAYNITEIGMPYYNNFDMYITGSGDVFVMGGAGIYICDYESMMKAGSMNTYTLLDSKAGLPGSITSNAWNYVTDDEHIYICGTSGVYLLDLNNYDMSFTDYKTKITSILLDGVFQEVTQIGKISIPKGTERIDLNLEINNFTSSDPFVSYYLSGVDEEKTTVLSSKLTDVTYYDIPYGNHDFVINVIDDKGRILSTQTYVLSKERELYETLGFILYFYIVIFSFFGFIVTSIIQGALWSQQKKEKNRHDLIVTQLEREKAEAIDRALHMEEDANRTKSEFLAKISHEIRTPINAIIGMDTMIMRESGEAQIRNYARDIHAAGNTLLSLISDIMDFSKIESGKMELVYREYDLSALINNIVNMMVPKAESKKLEFKVNVNPDIPNGLYGDDVRIEQIILKLLNNAVKYTEKGNVSFDVDYEKNGEGTILLKISVKDTGIGIKPEDVDKIFDPYERIGESGNKKAEGTGLGLSITKNLLEKMGSKLEIIGSYGEGSVFSFSLSQTVVHPDKIGDYRTRATERDPACSDVEKFHAPDANILIVDDVEMNLTVVTNLLKRIKARVDIAQSGAEAVEKSKLKQYDIILLDSMMPGMDGEETMHSIRKKCELNAETPIIVLTSHAVKGAREEYLSLGYTNYLSKPIDGNKLEAMIQSYLPDEKIILEFENEDNGSLSNGGADGNSCDDMMAVLSQISSIEGIDAVKGIESAGGEDAYILICRNFYDTAKMRIETIQDAIDKKDYDAYAVQLHALKSSARLIGALKLSEEALELEAAGREGNTDLIDSDNGSLVDKYKWFYEKLREVFE